jgi:transcriptional regulator with XRE-family HTH domain
VASPSSSAQQALKALVGRLREMRLDAHLTGQELARLAGWHSSKVSKIEHARQTPSDDDIREWCAHCGVTGQVVDLIASLRAVEGMFIEWRRMERTGFRLANESILPLWQRTRRFRVYSSFVVPGPVQTPDYITAILSAIRVRRDLPDDVEATVRVRVERQRVVNEGDRRFAIVVEESVLRAPIGGAEAMAAQLGHLLTVSALPSVSLGVIPLGADRSVMWPIESFWMFDDEQVSVELVSGLLTVTQPREIAMYAKVFADLAAQAVYGAEARQLIADAVAALDR